MRRKEKENVVISRCILEVKLGIDALNFDFTFLCGTRAVQKHVCCSNLEAIANWKAADLAQCVYQTVWLPGSVASRQCGWQAMPLADPFVVDLPESLIFVVIW